MHNSSPTYLSGQEENFEITHAEDAHSQERWVADVTPADALSRDAQLINSKPRSKWGDSWIILRKRPQFWIAAVLITLVILIAAFPGLFTNVDPQASDLSRSLEGPSAGHPLGFTHQGYDVYARVMYGARASVVTGIATTIIITLIGLSLGALAGYRGGWVDGILSRIADIYFAIPLLLAAIVLTQMFTVRNTWVVVGVLSAFGWVSMFRMVRAQVFTTKNEDYVEASKALGLGSFKIVLKHIIPNSLAPVIVLATMSLGAYIVAEATLSYLGIGLPPNIVSWGNDISSAQTTLRQAPMVLFYPSAALALTVLGFILMGDVVKDALDPKERS